jgi:transposase
MPRNSPPRSVEDVAGPWVEPTFESGLIQRCRRYWAVPVEELPNEALATYLRQGIALGLIAPEAKKRVQSGFKDGSEMYDGELAEALRKAGKV